MIVCFTKIKNNTIKKIKQKTLTIDKADKGNVLVINSKSTLIDKTLHFLKDDDFQILKFNPTPKYQTEIKIILNKCSYKNYNTGCR